MRRIKIEPPIKFTEKGLNNLDFLCATKLMNFNHIGENELTKEPLFRNEYGNIVVFSPTRDYNDSFAIVSHMKQEGWTLFFNSRRNEASGCFHDNGMAISRKEFAYTHYDERIVICMCALLSVGMDKAKLEGEDNV